MPIRIELFTERDREWARSLLRERWGDPKIVTRGRIHRADRLPGFVALDGDRRAGLLTFALADGDGEIVSLDALEPGKGIASALIKAVVDLAHVEGWRRIWLITTNDNTGAICFYQKVGFELVAIYRDAIKESRKVKSSIPDRGCGGIPIRDEIEFEIATR